MQKHAKEDNKPVPAVFPTEVDLGAYRIVDPEAFGRNVLRMMEEATRAMHGLLERAQRTAGSHTLAHDWAEAGRLLTAVMQPWLLEPARLIEAQGALFASYMQLMANTSQRAVGGNVAPVAEPDPGDNRFKDEQWEDHFVFDHVKQAYLIAARHIHDAVSGTNGLPPDSKSAQGAAIFNAQSLEQ